MTPIPDEEYWQEWWVAMGPDMTIALLQLGKILGKFHSLRETHTVQRMQAGTSEPQDALSQCTMLC